MIISKLGRFTPLGRMLAALALVACLVGVFSLGGLALTASVAGPNTGPPAFTGHASVRRLQACQRAAEHYFRLHQQAITIYRLELHLNPRQLYLFQVKTEKLAKAYYKAAWQCYGQLKARGVPIPGPVKARFLSDYAWFIYGNPIYVEPPKNAATLRRLLERARRADPSSVSVALKIYHLQQMQVSLLHGSAKARERASLGRSLRAILRAHPRDEGALVGIASYLARTKGLAASKKYWVLAARGFSRVSSLEGLRYDLQMWDDDRQIIGGWLKSLDPSAYWAFVRKYPNMQYMVQKIIRRDRRLRHVPAGLLGNAQR